MPVKILSADSSETQFLRAAIAMSHTPDASEPLKPVDYQIVHVTRGRFRLRIPQLISDADYAKQLGWLVESLDFVTHLRINPIVGSLVIYYAPQVSLATVQQGLASVIQQALVVEVPASPVLTKTDLRPEINWVDRLGLPVLSLGLAFAAQQLVVPIPALMIGGLLAVAAIPFVTRIFNIALNEKRLDADILDALWLGFYIVKRDFVAPALMLSLIETGDALRDSTARSNERQVFDLMQGIDQYAWIERNGKEQRVPVKEVQRGDRVVVYPGEIVPVSGRVLRGTALIDEHKLTGESKLVSRSEGQVVHASTLVLEGKICILTKRIGRNTRVGLTIDLMQSAPVHDTRVEDYSAKIAEATIAPSLLLSAAIFALTRDVSRALAPMHLDFSHAIRIAVPSTVLAALTYAARHGVYIRSGRALEVLARTDTVVFDKTGTLTQGAAAVITIKTPSRRIAQMDVLQIAASAERGNTHPVASAILNYAEEKQVVLHPCESWDYRIGFGVIAQITGQQVLVGSDRLLQQEGVEVEAIHLRYPDLRTSGNSVVYVACGGQLLGVIVYTDPLRSESTEVIATLKCQQQQTYMLTGDSYRVARHVSQQLGIDPDHVYAEAFPDRKVEVIADLQSQHRTVAFVGEGINDAAALAHADVSISFASGIDIARETADIVLLDDDLRGIPHAILIAKRAMEIVYQNTALVAIPNISVVMAGVVFALDPVLGVIISNGSALMAELNSFRPLFDPESDPIMRWMPSPDSSTAASPEDSMPLNPAPTG